MTGECQDHLNVRPRSEPFARRIARGLAAATMTLAAGVSHGQGTSAATDEVQLELVADHAQARAGERVWVGVRQRIAPHWHTYWLNPGDSGQATAIDWRLPPGARAGPIEWPVPQRIDTGPVTNYGYADEVMLLSEIQLPDTAQAGQTLRLSAHVSWLVCRDVCLPQEADLAVDLPVVAGQASTSGEPGRLDAARAALPQPARWPARWRHQDQDKALSLLWPAKGPLTTVQFFPEQWGLVQHAAPQRLERRGDDWILRMVPGETTLGPDQPLRGVLVLGEGANRQAWQLGARHDPAPAAGAPPASDLGLLAAMLLALAGGLLLNLMPCVFPVLSIKAVGLLQHAQEHPSVARRHGLAYTGGVLASFGALAGLLIVLKAGGAQVGWGFQFQSPLFVLVVAWLLFGLGLNLSGLLEIGGRFAGMGSAWADRAGLAGSFFSGVLTAVVATPCTAPFMGAAMAYALAQPAPSLLAVFLSLGLGVALPYLLISMWPALQALLPRPGPWMVLLKQGLAFPMYFAAIWLTWVLAQQAGPTAVLLALCGMGLLGLASWLHGIDHGTLGSALRRRGSRGGAVVCLAGMLWLAGLLNDERPQAEPGRAHVREPYSPQRLASLRSEGRAVFINLTASWCVSCLVNERVALSESSVRQAFVERGVTYLVGDWTQRDPLISALLSEHGRDGVPLYLFYPALAGSAPVILPQWLTPGIVIAALGADPSPPTATTLRGEP